MKKIYFYKNFFVKFIFIMVFVQLYHVSVFGQKTSIPSVTQNINGQDPPVTQNIFGEPIIGTGGGSALFPDIIVTPGTITYRTESGTYFSESSNFGELAIDFRSGTCPNVYFVLLNNGTLVRIEMKSSVVNFKYFTPAVNETGSFSCKDFNGDAFYVLTTSSHIYVSRDNFKTFQIDTTGFSRATLNAFALDSLQYVYAATSKGIFKENPDSNKWYSLNTFNLTGDVRTIFVDRKQNIYAGGANNKIYKSINLGISWTQDNLWNNGYVKQISDDAYGDIFVITHDLFIGDKIFKFPSGGSSWVQIDAGITNIANNLVSYNNLSGNSAIYASTNFGLFASTDRGTTWTEQDKGITSGTIYGYAKGKNGRDVASNVQGISFKNAADIVWQKTYPTNGFISGLPIYSDHSGNLYTVVKSKINNSFTPSSILKSTDNGNTWLPDTLGLSSTIGNLFYVDELSVQHMAGTSWSSYAPGFVFKKAINNRWTLDTTGTGAGKYMFGSSFLSDGKGFLYLSGSYPGRVFRRPMNGTTWISDTVGIPRTVNYFGFMSAHPDGTIFGSGLYSPYVFKRVNNVWAPVTIPLSTGDGKGNVITAMSIDTTGNIFLALQDWYKSPADIGVYYSKDKGTTWDYVALDSVQVNSLVSFGASTYAITNGYGVYLLKPGSSTDVKNSSSLPQSFELYQNYPNPFNPTTVISYQLSAFSHVTLKVYDVLGNEIKTLVNEYKPAGKHTINFDASKLASGVYFYQLKSGDYVNTKKLVLLK